LFSGVGFHPSIETLYRAVESTGETVTIAVAAETTLADIRTVMRNGEEVVITTDRIRMGGTLDVESATGITRKGELRIRESMTLVRPNASGMIVTKDGEYTIRFSLY
jgi:hypothetical protein